jgi:hypothetical protein
VHVRVVLLRLAVLKAYVDSHQFYFPGQLFLNLANNLPDGVLLLHVEIVKGSHVPRGHNHNMESGKRLWMRQGSRQFI